MEPPGCSVCSGPWLLVELPDISTAVGFPLQCTQRIKYTCFDVSKNLLIFGATSGGLYVFNREPCTFIQLIPNKEGSIVKIKISPHEKSVAFATHKGFICVSDCGTDVATYMKSTSLQISKEHQGNEITALIWNEIGNYVYAGDDTGIISSFHTSKSFAKNVFQNSTTTLMRLDSRIVQIDVKENLLLVSTLTRCFICDTQKEHYAQVGQKLRDGEYGGCFYYKSTDEVCTEDSSIATHQDANKTNGAYSILSEEEQLKCFEKLGYLKIFCARPGSRLWEVKINGSVVCTHQFKQLLATPPTEIISNSSYESDHYNDAKQVDSVEPSPQSVNFTKIYMIKNRYIFTFKKDGLYILDPAEPGVVMWSDQWKDIADCNIIDDVIYLWRLNGSVTILAFYKVEKFLLKCFVNQKFKLCAEICALNSSSLIKSIPLSKKIHLISGLGSKLQENGEVELFNKVCGVLEEIDKVKKINAQKSKPGIVKLENNFAIKDSNFEPTADVNYENESPNKHSPEEGDSTLFQLSPEAIQVIKDFGSTVSDKLTLGTKSLKKTWDSLEGKMKKIGTEKSYNGDDTCNVKGSDSACVCDEFAVGENINSENNCSITDNSNIVENKPMIKPNFTNGDATKRDKTIELIYHHIKLDEISGSDLPNPDHPIFANTACDINDVFQTILKVEDHMISLGNSTEYSGYQCGKLLLKFISKTPDVNKTIDAVIENQEMCSYFLQAFSNVNSSSAQISCECGYPLPSVKPNKTPLFSDILNIFIEKMWESSRSQECYDICKKVPYMWRKILLLRKNEDLLNLLLLILQILDEELLYTYLPQFTVTTWERAIKLLATLKRNECLNCGQVFAIDLQKHIILSWDSIGALMIKSIGCNNTINMLKIYSNLIPSNGLTLKFYHSCFFLRLFEKYDCTLSSNLIDTMYQAYEYEDAVCDMCKHLQESLIGDVPHTALPLSVACKSSHWGLRVHSTDDASDRPVSNISTPNFLEDVWSTENNTNAATTPTTQYIIGMDLENTLGFLNEICPNKDCHHCSLPLASRVLVADAGLWVFSCGHTFHGVCLKVLMVKLCPLCFKGKCSRV